MATSSSMQEQTTSKVDSKLSQILPSCWHLPNPKYAGHIRIGHESHFTEWFDTKEEAELERRCMEKRLSYELIETVEGEGYYPERAKLIEEKYQTSGRINGLYTGLNTEDGAVFNNTSN
jgi:hypothetical protein